jgi:hypothetical protein
MTFNDKFDDMMKRRVDLEILKATLRERSKIAVINWFLFIVLAVLTLYWFFPLTIDIINEKIIEEYGLLGTANLIIPTVVVEIIPGMVII